MSRVYIGNLSSRATERDIENFFRGFGRIRDVMLKNGFGFVVFYFRFSYFLFILNQNLGI